MSVRRIAKALGAIGLALLLAMVTAAMVVLARPEWFITPRLVTEAMRTFGGSYQPSWSSLDFRIHSKSVLEKEIAFSASGLCFAHYGTATGGCLGRLTLQFSVELGVSGLRIPRVSRLDVEGDRLVVDLRRHAPEKPESKKKSTMALPSALRDTTLGPITIHVPRLRVIETSAVTRASADIDYAPGEARPLKLFAEAFRLDRGTKRPESMRATIEGASDLRSARVTAKVRGRDLDVDVGLRASRLKGSSVALRLAASGHAGKLILQGIAAGAHHPSGDRLEGALTVRLSSGPVQELHLRPFVLLTRYVDGESTPRTLRFSGRFTAPITSLPSGPVFRAPPKISGQLVIAAGLAPTRAAKDRFHATAAARLDRYRDWYSFGGAVKLAVAGRLSEIKSARLSHDIDLDLAIPRFERLVAELASSKLAVPAPLAVLKGPVRLSIRCRGTPSSESQSIVYRLTSDLAAEKEKLIVRGEGELSLLRPLSPQRKFSNKATIRLEEIVLDLPQLEPARIPAVKLDPRILPPNRAKTPVAAEKKRPAFPLSNTIRMVTGKPILIHSNLAKDPIPITVDLSLADPPVTFSGTVAASDFRAEVFRRSAKIDHFRLTRLPDSDANQIDGLILYNAQDVQVRIRVLGTTDKPHVVLESVPPLSQSEIVGLLLYGKSPNDLDPDQQSTVANTQSAMADSAFGLASLYLFASTPIEFVGFDPASRTYTMRFRVPGGASLEIGSTLEASRTVQLRKRLAAHFAIEAQARNTPEGNSVGTFLEWFNRY